MKQVAWGWMLLTMTLPAVAADTPAGEPDPAPAKAPVQAAKPTTMDRLQLESTTITGNRELPKVMYVVPWKHADAGDPGSRPLRSLVDEVLEPVDREVFARQNSYFQALGQRPEAAVETSVTAGKPAP